MSELRPLSINRGQITFTTLSPDGEDSGETHYRQGRSSLATDTLIELKDIHVIRVRADMKGKGPSAAFNLLESRLPSLKGRRFYGTFRMLSNGEEEYYACVEMVDEDDPKAMQLDTGLIPGGVYVRRRVMGWEKVVREGRLPALFGRFAASYEPYIDHEEIRPSIEFYRSHEELLMLMPVRKDTPLEAVAFRSVEMS